MPSKKAKSKSSKQGGGGQKAAQGMRFPANVVEPVAQFLQARLTDLKKRKEKIEKEDPFSDTSRVLDNASPDTDAAEQFGHAKTSAVKQQITKSIIQTRKALTRVKIGKYGICEDCGQMIDTDRLMIYPEATLCVKCMKKREK
jgi:DnaK suppressor protein